MRVKDKWGDRKNEGLEQREEEQDRRKEAPQNENAGISNNGYPLLYLNCW